MEVTLRGLPGKLQLEGTFFHQKIFLEHCLCVKFCTNFRDIPVNKTHVTSCHGAYKIVGKTNIKQIIIPIII